MRIHYLQHVPFENLAFIERWVESRGHSLSVTQLFADEPLPSVGLMDWLIVLGGPMNIYEEDRYPWLAREKRFIGESVKSGKIILGICLGAQLIADVLGAQVTKNTHREIGWFPVEATSDAAGEDLHNFFPHRFMAFHWHGDTFGIPAGAVRLARSEGCENQAFAYGDRVLGLQFHLESEPESVQRLIGNCGDEITRGPYVQSPEQMLSDGDRFRNINDLMGKILDRLEKIGRTAVR